MNVEQMAGLVPAIYVCKIARLREEAPRDGTDESRSRRMSLQQRSEIPDGMHIEMERADRNG
jgi:hypothetical protein